MTPMMTRRIVRTLVQLSVVTLLTFFTILFLDRNFRVLPKSMHHYMPQHHHGLVLTDLTITKCSTLNIFSSCKMDPNKWHRIEKDLYLGKSWSTSVYVHVARKKEEELLDHDKVLMDVSVGRLDPAVAKQAKDERWESRPFGLWVKRSTNQKKSDSEKAVTAIDVLFGDDAVEARDGWEMTGTALLLPPNQDVPVTHITIRRGSQMEPHKPQPRIPENGRFKIIQLADLHLSNGVGKCRDAIPEGHNGGVCEADTRTLDFVSKILNEERPNLVVLSGDQVNGDTAPDAQSAIFKIAHILIKMKIPYISIFGNHDDEDSLPRAAQMQILESLPYSLARAGPEDLDGVGNYYVEVLARGKSDHSALTLYMLDTHAYTPNEEMYHGYDWIKPNQIDWFKKTSMSLKKAHKEYSKVHLDLAFIHIPLPEYRDPGLAIKGTWREGVTAPRYNSGFRDALVEQGVVMVSCGHDHVNDYCSLSLDDQQKPALWMCYAGAAGFGGYAGYGGYHRRVRIFEVDTNEARITTWKRVEWGETEKRIDEHMIVEAGSPVGL